MHLNAETAATAVMTAAIAGVGLAWVALLLLLRGALDGIGSGR